jgi:hypothetical protein
MKVLMILVVLNVFNLQDTEVNYKSNVNEQIVSYQIEQKKELRYHINNFINLLNKYILRNNIGIMTEDDYIDFLSIFLD